MIAEVDGGPLGFIQIMDSARGGTQYWVETEPGISAIDIWIGEEADLGRGYGTQMMRLALDRCFADQAVKAVLLDPLASNTRAHRFYERLGFEAVDRRMFGTEDCLVHRLARDVWQVEIRGSDGVVNRDKLAVDYKHHRSPHVAEQPRT